MVQRPQAGQRVGQHLLLILAEPLAAQRAAVAAQQLVLLTGLGMVEVEHADGLLVRPFIAGAQAGQLAHVHRASPARREARQAVVVAVVRRGGDGGRLVVGADVDVGAVPAAPSPFREGHAGYRVVAPVQETTLHGRPEAGEDLDVGALDGAGVVAAVGAAGLPHTFQGFHVPAS